VEGDRRVAKQVPARLTIQERRRFGLTVGGAFLVLAALSRWRGHDVAPLVLAGLGAGLVLAGAIVPSLLGPVYLWWMALARILSKVTTPIFMGLVYFGAIMPTGLVMRALGRNPLRARARDGSYWVQHQSSSDHSMTRQF
jgi:hypothetical protein